MFWWFISRFRFVDYCDWFAYVIKFAEDRGKSPFFWNRYMYIKICTYMYLPVKIILNIQSSFEIFIIILYYTHILCLFMQFNFGESSILEFSGICSALPIDGSFLIQNGFFVIYKNHKFEKKIIHIFCDTN